jgi:hypothetical protein
MFLTFALHPHEQIFQVDLVSLKDQRFLDSKAGIQQ